MMRVNNIQLESGKQAVNKRRDGDRGWDINSGRQVQAWIAKDERVQVCMICMFLRKDKYIMPLVGKLIAKRTDRANDPTDHWKIGVREIGDMHG